MVTNFGMLCHDTYTKYLSRHATSNVADTLLYGDNTSLLDEKKSLCVHTTSVAQLVERLP